MNIWIKPVIITFLCLPVEGKTQVFSKVAPADLSKLRPDDFSDEELDLPFYLAHFHRIANAVVQTGDSRGFIDIAVWRRDRDNEPYNARIMENCLSLAYFYCTHRPWNPYYADPALRERLEAALDFWCRIQNNDGRFSEYKPGGWSLAPTAFATKFMGETLTLLEEGPKIDSALHKRVIEAMRKALVIVFTDVAMYAHGGRYTNQYTNAFAGALAFLSIRPDKEIEYLLNEKVRQTHTTFQSPAGYFYERDGADWGYNLTTHHSNLLMAYRYSRGMSLQKFFVEEEQKFVEWLSYNAVLEPGTSRYFLNRAIETRQRRAFLDTLGVFDKQEAFLSGEVPLSRVFLQTQQEVQKTVVKLRRHLEDNWPNVRELEVGEFWSYSPYVFLNRKHKRFFPTDSQRETATSMLPYMKKEPFIHQRVDSRRPVHFTYVHRPTYYAIFNSGSIVSSQQRYGIGLIWIPEIGAILQSQTGSENAAWGTKLEDQQLVCEAESLDAQFNIDGKAISPLPGNRDLFNGIMSISYPLGQSGMKEVIFKESEIRVSIIFNGTFTEYLPLLLGQEDRIEIEKGRFNLRRAKRLVSMDVVPAVLPDVIKAREIVGGKRIVPVILHGTGKLIYSIQFNTDE